jgi:radical SAM protein with 4Fe4S-binding SPASM domain
MIKRSIRVAFLGGEPTLNKDLYRMIKYANEIGKITNFITNASRLHENDFIKIKQSGVDVVGISLYENNSDDVCRVVQGFNRLNIMFWVQVVISQSMIPKLRSYVEDLLASGCGSLILSKYNPYFDKKYSQVVEADDPSYIEFENWLKANVKNRMRIQFLNREKQKVKTIQKKCRLPFSYIHVDSKGDLGPCCFRYPKNEYGNIYNNQAWNGAKTIELRDNLLDSTKDPIGECVNCENLHRDLYGF